MGIFLKVWRIYLQNVNYNILMIKMKSKQWLDTASISETWSAQQMINKETAEHYLWGNNCYGWHLVKQPELSVIHELMPPGTFERIAAVPTLNVFIG